ncbi:MAG: hypothetical protein H0V27_09290 [Pyrinomonadaceae bacterium]|nr:hypothetical protein [Pyrinomonadaceae bacterium]
MTTPNHTTLERAWNECAPDVAALHARCAQAAPNYNVSAEDFARALNVAANKYLAASDPSVDDVRRFVNEVQSADLYLALACAAGNEHAWWDFDGGYRRYIERVARHLAKAERDAEDVVDHVYTELYGTREVEGVRQSKFRTYTGRGTLRGWLRAIVWHATVDLHRARHHEVSLDAWSAGAGVAEERPEVSRSEARGGETEMLDEITRRRYREATVEALNTAFAGLGEHEKLLLLFYHVENLKLREIARLVEQPASPLRVWFQRKRRGGSSNSSEMNSNNGRVHESTVMRWLEKVYATVLERFREELKTTGGLSEAEIEICMSMATDDLAPEDVRRHLTQQPTP